MVFAHFICAHLGKLDRKHLRHTPLPEVAPAPYYRLKIVLQRFSRMREEAQYNVVEPGEKPVKAGNFCIEHTE